MQESGSVSRTGNRPISHAFRWSHFATMHGVSEDASPGTLTTLRSNHCHHQDIPRPPVTTTITNIKINDKERGQHKPVAAVAQRSMSSTNLHTLQHKPSYPSVSLLLFSDSAFSAEKCQPSLTTTHRTLLCFFFCAVALHQIWGEVNLQRDGSDLEVSHERSLQKPLPFVKDAESYWINMNRQW